MGNHFTCLFEALAIELLKAVNIKRVTEILRISWGEVWHVMERAVSRGRTAIG